MNRSWVHEEPLTPKKYVNWPRYFIWWNSSKVDLRVRLDECGGPVALVGGCYLQNEVGAFSPVVPPAWELVMIFEKYVWNANSSGFKKKNLFSHWGIYRHLMARPLFSDLRCHVSHVCLPTPPRSIALTPTRIVVGHGHVWCWVIFVYLTAIYLAKYSGGRRRWPLNGGRLMWA